MKNFVDLKNYLIKEIKPQENYQYFVLKELISSGGKISYDELANRYDAKYENTNKTDTKTILKDAPTIALSRHGYITSDKHNVYANFNDEPLYYKETISWILEKSLDHLTKNNSVMGLEFKEGIIKTDKEIESFCYENNIPRDLVEKIILSINRGEKQVILDGPPGTGKTYLIKKIIQFLADEVSISDLVQFHPSYGYEEFVEGLRPTTKDTSLSFEVVSGKLLDLLSKTKSSYPINQTLKSSIKNSGSNILHQFSSPEVLTSLNINELPESPGVHLIYYKDSLLYVGETGNTRRRITEHMRSHHASGDTFIKHSQKKFQLDLSKDEDKKMFDDLRARMTLIYKITEDKENLKNKIIDELKPEFNQKLAPNKNDLHGISWAMLSEDEIVKYVDYSVFKHNTSTVPKEFYAFFSLDPAADEKIEITLEDINKNSYKSHIRTASKSRTSPAKLIKWNRDFTNFLKLNIPEWESIEKGIIQNKYGLIFKISNSKNSFLTSIRNFDNENNNLHLDTFVKSDFKNNESFGSFDFLIIDEINRGNLPKIFGELLNAFEYRDENISLQYSDKPLSVPSNLIFLGTMNSTDKSVGRMDAALRRRFDFIHVEPNYEVLEKYYENKELLVPNLIEGLEILNEVLEKDLGKHCLIGHTYFMKNHDSPFTYDDIKKIWDRKIYPLLEEYFLDDITKLEKYQSYKIFWGEYDNENSNKSGQPKRYSRELLSEHLSEISLDLKDLQMKLEEWGENIKKLKVYRGFYNKEFRSGGRTWQYFLTDNSKGRYDLFKLSGIGNVVIPYHSLKGRAPFTNLEFINQFEDKLKSYFNKFNISLKKDFFLKAKPSFLMQDLIDSNSLDEFLEIWDWVIEEINNTDNKYE